ncbi:major outer membrane protein [Campylobacter sp. FMV-PI01]|uniref:Major outer membrane protein n=1 Tax=Campylobacter portucalensis TaxID=2608384 RepID=A0A6L5WG83_9BACT|nr:major outer membrane protein [Campylobacter portucalensis]MSN96168.1 major outer membrane protein [Campylobacter portucalensis]
MKLVKLSLVAAMAAGVLATSASAVAFEEAIKDVDVSGMARLRYNYKKEKENSDKAEDESRWNFKGVLNLKSMIDDNFFAFVGVRYTSNDEGSKHEDKTKHTFDIHRAYLGYNIAGTTIQLGRQDVGAFFTDDMYGTGVKVVNTDVPGLTLAGLWMDALEHDGEIGTDNGDFNETMKYKQVLESHGLKKTPDHSLWGVAAIGSYDPVSFQLWYASLEDVTDLFAAEVALSFDITDSVNLGLKGQYAFADFDKKFKKGVGVIDDSNFFGAEATANFFGVDTSLGWVNFKTKEDKKSLSSFEDQGSFITAGEQTLDYSVFSGKNQYFFVTAGYTIPDSGIRVGGEYLKGYEKTNKEKTKKQEIVGRVGYEYSDKLSFDSFYSYATEKKGDGNKTKNTQIRFEAKYSF